MEITKYDWKKKGSPMGSDWRGGLSCSYFAAGFLHTYFQENPAAESGNSGTLR